MSDTRALRRLINDLANELFVLHAAWQIVEDDNRRTKALYVNPRVARKWKSLIDRAKLTRAASSPERREARE